MNYFHVVVSANQDRPVFSDPEVQRDLLHRLEPTGGSGSEVAAYALLPAHAHFLIGLKDPEAIGPVLQGMIGPVAWGLNRRLKQRGGVFRPAWRSSVDSEACMWTLPLYIHANLDPHGTDAERLDVGLQSSHRAYLRGDCPWLRPGAALDQYQGAYAATIADFLECRAAQAATGLEVAPNLEQAVYAVARVSGVRPSTLLDDARGGKRDRMLLAWFITGMAGPAAAATLLKRTRQTAARWTIAVEADESYADWRTRLGDPALRRGMPD